MEDVEVLAREEVEEAARSEEFRVPMEIYTNIRPVEEDLYPLSS